MARPSVADERTAQILEATFATIAARGLSGTTLDKIAETAGMSRGHVRHFAGNRDRLLLAAARDFYATESGAPGIIPDTIDTLETAVNYLFGDEFAASNSENAVVLAFVELARSSADIAEVLNEAYSATRTLLSQLVAKEKPALTAERAEWVAEGVLALALGNVFLGDFDADTGHTVRTRAAAEALIATV